MGLLVISRVTSQVCVSGLWKLPTGLPLAQNQPQTRLPLIHIQIIQPLSERTRGRTWGRLRVRIRSVEKGEVGSFTLLHKISRTACCFGIRTFLKQYNCYGSATIWYTDIQYLAQYSEIMNNLQEMPLMFCNYAVCSCGTWRKGPCQSPRNVLSISDLELYVTERSTGVCDPVTD